MTAMHTIRVVAAGLCGSDVHRLRSGFAPASLGHEVVGRRPSDGRLVAIRPLRPCRICAVCLLGWTEQCAHDSSIGRHDTGQGGFSGHVRVTAEQLYEVPESLSPTLATLADPLACILHAMRRLEVADADVLVIGDGSMAALAAVHAHRRGAAQVTIAVKDRGRLARMAAFGDRVVTAEDLSSDPYHVVVESAGGTSSEPILMAVAAVAPLGTVVALGVYSPQATVSLPVRNLLEKESTLRGSRAYRVNDDGDDFAAALELLATAPGDFASIITSTHPWSPNQPPVLERGRGLKTVYVTETGPEDT
jgi:threonine dehydrogenase-like Zn-dependent dehydrogenase